MSVLKTKDLSKIYDEGAVPIYALNSVSLEIKEGEFTAIVGPSGSGKTTLLNILGGLDIPSKGNVWVRDQDIFELSDKDRIDFRLHSIGFVFQAYNLIPVLTAKENVAFILQLQNRPHKECEEISEAMLESVGLKDRMNNRPSELSGGQQQRVAVARALASKPAFVLADEPTANLDSKSSSSLLDIMAELNEKQNMTFIFSTHDSRVIERARRIITLEDGKIISDETR